MLDANVNLTTNNHTGEILKSVIQGLFYECKRHGLSVVFRHIFSSLNLLPFH